MFVRHSLSHTHTHTHTHTLPLPATHTPSLPYSHTNYLSHSHTPAPQPHTHSLIPHTTHTHTHSFYLSLYLSLGLCGVDLPIESAEDSVGDAWGFYNEVNIISTELDIHRNLYHYYLLSFLFENADCHDSFLPSSSTH